MKYTLADCIDTINQVLNYPSVDYTDISHFFDQAISELNTELNIGLRPISELYKDANFKIDELKYITVLDERPSAYVPLYDEAADSTQMVFYKVENDVIQLYYRTSPRTEAIKVPEGETLYATSRTSSIDNKYEDVYEIYQVLVIGGTVYWSPYEYTATATRVNLTDFLPRDWIHLYLIPYVCFKYSSRNGNSSVLYVEEFTQGFQQLQKSYDVPSFVNLAANADLPAYTQDVEENLPNINITIPTRAIYDSMKVSRVIHAKYGTMYDNGGWGV